MGGSRVVNPEFHPLIIPTIVIPFTALLAALSALATLIAALFGIQLKAEGPKKLLEVLLKPKILLSALLLNLLLIGGVTGYRYIKNFPVPLFLIEKRHTALSDHSTRTYSNTPTQRLFDRPTLSPQPGKLTLQWTTDLQSGSFRGLVVSKQSGFIGTNQGLVQEVDLQNGSLLRSFYVGTAISAAPVIFDQFLYVGEGQHDTHHARIYQFSLKTGILEKTFQSKGHIEASSEFSADGTLMIFPSGSGGITALEVPSLRPLWHARHGHVDGAALIDKDLVFSGSGVEKERLVASKVKAFAYDLQTGRPRWQRQLPASSWMKPIPWHDQVCFIFGEVYFSSDLGGLACFQKKNGEPGTTYLHDTPIVSEVTRLGDDVIFADLNGQICRISLQDGRRHWCRQTGPASRALGHAVYDEAHGTLGYASQSEGFFVLDPATGSILAHWNETSEKKPWGKVYAPPTPTEDGWIVVNMKGVMRKLRWSRESAL